MLTFPEMNPFQDLILMALVTKKHHRRLLKAYPSMRVGVGGCCRELVVREEIDMGQPIAEYVRKLVGKSEMKSRRTTYKAVGMGSDYILQVHGCDKYVHATVLDNNSQYSNQSFV